MAQQHENTPEQVHESKVIGVARPRIDGPLEDHRTGTVLVRSHFPGLVYAWPTTATVASGTVKRLTRLLRRRCPACSPYTHTRRLVRSIGFHLVLDSAF